MPENKGPDFDPDDPIGPGFEPDDPDSQNDEDLEERRKRLFGVKLPELHLFNRGGDRVSVEVEEPEIDFEEGLDLDQRKERLLRLLEGKDREQNEAIDMRRNREGFPKFWDWYKRDSSARIISGALVSVSALVVPGADVVAPYVRGMLSGLGVGNAVHAGMSRKEMAKILEVVGERDEATGQYDLSQIDDVETLIEIRGKLSEITSSQGLMISMDLAREDQEIYDEMKQREEQELLPWRKKLIEFQNKYGRLPFWQKAAIAGGVALLGVGVSTGVAAATGAASAGVVAAGAINFAWGMVRSQREKKQQASEYSDLVYEIDRELVDRMSGSDRAQDIYDKIVREEKDMASMRIGIPLMAGVLAAAATAGASVLIHGMSHSESAAHSSREYYTAHEVTPNPSTAPEPSVDDHPTPGISVPGGTPPVPTVEAPHGFNFFQEGPAGDAHKEAFMHEMQGSHGSEKAAQEILLAYGKSHPDAHLDPNKFHDQFVAARGILSKELIHKGIFNADGSLSSEFADPEKLRAAFDASHQAELVSTVVSLPGVPIDRVSPQENVYDASHAAAGTTYHEAGTPLPNHADDASRALEQKASETKVSHSVPSGGRPEIENPHVVPQAEDLTKPVADHAKEITQSTFDRGDKISLDTLKKLVGYDQINKPQQHGDSNYLNGYFRPWIMNMIERGKIHDGDVRVALDADGNPQLNIAVPHDAEIQNTGINGEHLGVPIIDNHGLKFENGTYKLADGTTLMRTATAPPPPTFDKPFFHAQEQASQSAEAAKIKFGYGETSPHKIIDTAAHPRPDNVSDTIVSPHSDAASSEATQHIDQKVSEPAGIPHEKINIPGPKPVDAEIPVPEAPFDLNQFRADNGITDAQIRSALADWFKANESKYPHEQLFLRLRDAMNGPGGKELIDKLESIKKK